MRRCVAVALIAAVASACVPVAVGCTIEQANAASARGIVLTPGEARRIAGTPLTITLTAVEDDSRCPKGVECIWAGDVAVRLRLASTDAPPSEITLHLNAGTREAAHAGHRVALVAVAPYPEGGEKIALERYRVMIDVTRE